MVSGSARTVNKTVFDSILAMNTVALTEWLGDTLRAVRTGDRTLLADSAYQLYLGGLRRAGSMYNYGTPIYDREWDLLVVLDACRADLVPPVADDYDFLTDETTASVASATEEWIEKSFATAYDDDVSETVYVTGNPHSDEGLDPGRFRHVEEVWAHSWDDDIGTVLADTVTDHAVAAGRQFDADRFVVHYMQPHHPFVPTPDLNEGIGYGDENEYNHIWEKLRRGAVSREDVWQGYVENLQYVLDSVETLLENFDADTAVITSDHGNAMGEWGVYGHPLYVPLNCLKRVPYCRTSATDRGRYDPDVTITLSTDVTVGEVGDRLRDLGYV